MTTLTLNQAPPTSARGTIPDCAMPTPIPPSHDPRPTARTVYSLEWLDFGPTGNTPRWLAMAFPNYEDETTDRDYALACYQAIAATDPDRIHLVQTDHRAQIIAPEQASPSSAALRPTGASETAVMPVWLTAYQLTLLSYLLCLQQRQLETVDGDPEPIATAIQSDGRPIAERVGLDGSCAKSCRKL